jgi:hypothetical protein
MRDRTKLRAFELADQLVIRVYADTLTRLEFLNDQLHKPLSNLAIETSKVLSGLIRSLRSSSL